MKYIMTCIALLCIICSTSAYGSETKGSWIHTTGEDAPIVVLKAPTKNFNIKKPVWFFKDNVKRFNHMIYIIPNRESDGFAKFIFVIEPLQWDDPKYDKNML